MTLDIISCVIMFKMVISYLSLLIQTINLQIFLPNLSMKRDWTSLNMILAWLMDLLCVDEYFRSLNVVIILYLFGIFMVFSLFSIPWIILVLYNISLLSVYYSYLRYQAIFVKVYVKYTLGLYPDKSIRMVYFQYLIYYTGY